MSMWGDRRRRAHRAQTGDLAAAQRVVDQALTVARIDAMLRFELALPERDRATIDALLDARNGDGRPVLRRPSVPVIPGRPS